MRKPVYVEKPTEPETERYYVIGYPGLVFINKCCMTRGEIKLLRPQPLVHVVKQQLPLKVLPQ